MFVAFLSLGAFYYQFEIQTVSRDRLKRVLDEKKILSNDPVEIEGVLQGKPELYPDGFALILKAEKVVYKNSQSEVSGRVKFYAPTGETENKQEYDKLNLRYGSKIRVACRLIREDTYLNPGVYSRLDILEQQNIDATAVIKSPLLVERAGDETGFSPVAWIFEQRQNLIIQFRQKFTQKTSGIMIASLLGNKNFLDKETADTFREGGTFHVLVISGLHITFIGALVLLIVRVFTDQRFWQFTFTSIFLWGYSIAVGAEVPVTRAAFMFTILLFSKVIYRNGSLLNSFGFCTLVLLVWRPHDLFTSSFQLTFASVFAILVFAFPLIENLRKIGNWTPTTESPFPPHASKTLKRFCELLYWREDIWLIESKRQIWSAKLFKSPYLPNLQKGVWQTIFAYLFEGILVSLIVQVCLLPLLIIYFHRISFASVWLNIWVGFFIALESFSAILALLAAQFSEITALPLIKLTELLNWLLLIVPQLFVAGEMASIRVPVYSGLMKVSYFGYFIPILIFGFLLNQWSPFEPEKTKNLRHFISIPIISFFVLLFLISFHPFSAPRADGKLKADFLDVGQGDSSFVTFPNGQTLLIDGGGKINFNKNRSKSEDTGEDEKFEADLLTIGETVVSEFLWERGYSKIDYILATHADTDHLQGLIDVAENFQIKAALFGRIPKNDEDFIKLTKVLERKKIPLIVLSRGDILDFDGAKVEILHPDADNSESAISDNNHSIVLRIIFGNKRLLFTGDIEKETEHKLSQNPIFLQADVVKVPHHGSRTSSIQSFVTSINADYAIIPVGKRSQFGHPHQEVVERWEMSGAKILKTGERGTITVTTNGKDFEIQTYQK